MAQTHEGTTLIPATQSSNKMPLRLCRLWHYRQPKLGAAYLFTSMMCPSSTPLSFNCLTNSREQMHGPKTLICILMQKVYPSSTQDRWRYWVYCQVFGYASNKIHLGEDDFVRYSVMHLMENTAHRLLIIAVRLTAWRLTTWWNKAYWKRITLLLQDLKLWPHQLSYWLVY